MSARELAQLASYLEWVNPDTADTLAWQRYANCRSYDTELFFGARGNSTTKEAKKVCRNCTVRDECLSYAITEGIIHGVWGGLSEKERRRYRASTGNRDIRKISRWNHGTDGGWDRGCRCSVCLNWARSRGIGA